MSMTLTSQAFADGEPIPSKYTGDGQDISPPIQWANMPKGAISLALVCDDPDAPAGTWDHWIVYNIPATTEGAEEGISSTKAARKPPMWDEGLNSWGNVGYQGPKPPPGAPHHYVFTLYALDTALDLKAGLTKKSLLNTIKAHTLATARLVGTYQR